jgi:tetratricopeptide (TPR) repeat protein
MFFPRLRRSTKPVFIGLAVVFALSFVFLGVGSGSTGLGDLLHGNFSLFGHGGGSSGSINKAQKEIRTHPKGPQGYRDLATAYEARHEDDKAIAPLIRYTGLRPHDQDALRELADLYVSQARTLSAEANAAQAADPIATSAPFFAVAATTKIGQALGQDPIIGALSQAVNTTVQEKSLGIQQAGRNAVGVYKRLAAVSPNDASTQLELAQTAEQVGDISTAVAAYRKVIKLEPDSSDVPAIKQRIKALGGAATGTAATSG